MDQRRAGPLLRRRPLILILAAPDSSRRLLTDDEPNQPEDEPNQPEDGPNDDEPNQPEDGHNESQTWRWGCSKCRRAKRGCLVCRVWASTGERSYYVDRDGYIAHP